MLKPENFYTGAVLYHKPRKHYYRLTMPTEIKTESGWHFGWVYQECCEGIPVTKVKRRIFVNMGRTCFTRPQAMFDADWTFIQ